MNYEIEQFEAPNRFLLFSYLKLLYLGYNRLEGLIRIERLVFLYVLLFSLLNLISKNTIFVQ